MTNDDKATFGYYMVGVFDVLGQSRKLREQTGLPLADDPAELQRLIQNLQDTAGIVSRFRLSFKKFFEAAAKHTGRADSLPPPQRDEMLAAMSSNVMCWGVSDSFFVAVPLARTHPAAGVTDVCRSFFAAGNMWLLGLSKNHPIRGGIENGTGIDIEPGEIYGQALEAAYYLESTVARLPRIVVGPKCVEFLEAVKSSGNVSDVSSILAAGIADLCLSMLRQDADDDNTIVDGLGHTIREQSRDIPDVHDQFSRAHENVRANCLYFHSAGDEKLASRYETLRAYFDECAPNWHNSSR